MLCKYLMVYYVGTGLFFTYISEAHGPASWFDHAVCSTGTEHKHVLSCDTLNDITFGDHLPV